MGNWKLERWLSNALDNSSIAERVTNLANGGSERELLIVACALLDTALAEMLEARLLDDRSEVVDSLGADGNGRSPAGSFGARIQLAYLLGLIYQDETRMLRAFKALRNRMAHRIEESLLSVECQKELEKLRPSPSAIQQNVPPEGLEGFAEFLEDSKARVDGAKLLVALVLAMLLAICRDRHSKIVRLTPLAL